MYTYRNSYDRSSVTGCLGCFHWLAIVKRTAKAMDVQVLPWQVDFLLNCIAGLHNSFCLFVFVFFFLKFLLLNRHADFHHGHTYLHPHQLQVQHGPYCLAPPQSSVRPPVPCLSWARVPDVSALPIMPCAFDFGVSALASGAAG